MNTKSYSFGVKFTTLCPFIKLNEAVVAAFGSCMTCHQVLQGFPGVSEVLLHRNSNMTCLYCASCHKYSCFTACRLLQFEYDGIHL